MSPEPESWIGRERSREDRITLSRVRQMRALLDRDPDRARRGEGLPPGWHWLFFNPAARHSRLGRDGHEERGDFLPPIDLPRRMWAGGRIRFHAPLSVGAEAARRSIIRSVEEKEGRSGRLVFVTVGHEIRTGEGTLAVEEEQDLVYREAPDPSAPIGRGPETPDGAEWSEEFVADEVALFRFSALTFNGHRIHYDHPYATDVEGYPGLVVHGPLLALLLLDAAARWSGSEPDRFAYRATAPVFCGETVRIEGARDGSAGEIRLWAASPERGVAMRGTVR